MKCIKYKDLIFPKNQPRSGWNHRRHLLAFDSKQLYCKYAMREVYKDNTLCVSPSVSYYKDVVKKLSFSEDPEDFFQLVLNSKHYRRESK